MNDAPQPEVTKQRYLWPWIVAAMVLVGVVIAIVSVRQEAQRIREQRQPQMPTSVP